MQSSAMNCLPARLNAATHSPIESLSGPAGARPARASVAVDKGEPPQAGLRRTLATSAREQPHRCPDPAGDQEARAERARCDDRQLRPQLRPDVGRLADLRAQVIDRVGELLALGLDLAANLLEGAAV